MKCSRSSWKNISSLKKNLRSSERDMGSQATRDSIVQFIRHWASRTGLSLIVLIGWLGIAWSKFGRWSQRLGTPNAAEPQPNRMNKYGVLPSIWCCQDTHVEGERHENAFAVRRQVYIADRRCAFLFVAVHEGGIGGIKRPWICVVTGKREGSAWPRRSASKHEVR